MDEPPWKKLRLSLERPYKDDDGNSIPALLDITPNGEHIYETKQSSSTRLSENLRRIFAERGPDFFEHTTDLYSEAPSLDSKDLDEPDGEQDSGPTQVDGPNDLIMTPEDLYKMRVEILPQLYIAFGEMSHARDVLSSLLAASSPENSNKPTDLSATIANPPPPVISVQAFNAQLTVGSKDEALRKAASLFKTAAESMERGRIRGEKYWVDALKIRIGNWGLIPAPLPPGSAVGKGADKISKDFIISYGLEESPISFRRSAVAQMPEYNTASHELIFKHRQFTRLRVSVTSVSRSGEAIHSYNHMDDNQDGTLSGALKTAQREIFEQEIFSIIVKEAAHLPTASARVSERLVVIDAAQGVELRFELVDSKSSTDSSSTSSHKVCDLIYNSLHILLLCRHSYLKQERLKTSGTVQDTSLPSILQLVIDLLQYRVFYDRIEFEVTRASLALAAAGIPSTVLFNPVGETGQQLVNLMQGSGSKALSGQAILRIDHRHTIRLTFLSPSSLTAHLSQATLTVSSVPQLCQLVMDEIEHCLLQQICEHGRELCSNFGGTWFVDLNRCIGRWEGCVLNFRLFYGADFAIDCSAFRLDTSTGNRGQLQLYSTEKRAGTSLMSWVQRIIKDTI